MAVKRLADAGTRITHEKFPLFDAMGEINAKGGIAPAEACAIHRDRLSRRAADVDPNVGMRIERGCAVSAADYVEMVRERDRLVRAMDARLAVLDVLVMPTTSIVAPTIAEVADPKVSSPPQCRAAAQHRHHQLLRPLRRLAAAPGAAAGRADAGGAQ